MNLEEKELEHLLAGLGFEPALDLKNKFLHAQIQPLKYHRYTDSKKRAASKAALLNKKYTLRLRVSV